MKKGGFRSRLGVVVATLILVFMLGSACGSGETSSSQPSGAGGPQPPVISSLVAEQTQTHPSGSIEVECVASDPNGDEMDFEWSCTGGNFGPTAPTIVTWNAPVDYGDYVISVTVEDGKGGSAQQSVTLSVVPNQSPQVSVNADPKAVPLGGSSTITCSATDPDGDKLRYSWSVGEGDISGVGDKVSWIAPNKEGTFEIAVIVSDDKSQVLKDPLGVPAYRGQGHNIIVFPMIDDNRHIYAVLQVGLKFRKGEGRRQENEFLNAFRALTCKYCSHHPAKA